MISAYSPDSVRAAEQPLLASQPTGTLMRLAAQGLAGVVAARARRFAAISVVFLVGPGNNGGDALYAAAELADIPNLDVAVVLVSAQPHNAGLQAARDHSAVTIHDCASELSKSGRAELANAHIVVDGMLGLGARPGLRGVMAQAADAINPTAYVIAVDLPSGADPAGRIATSESVFADETVTFGVMKPVHLLPATQACVGVVSVIDIGLGELAEPVAERLDFAAAAALWPVPGSTDHKYTRGVLGIVAGSESYPGAAVLSCTAAVEAGAGMVRFVGPPTPTQLVLHATPEVVPRNGRVQAWVLGPGVDPDDTSVASRAQQRAIGRALASAEPCVLDAGALHLFTEPRKAATLITPHAGELAALLTRWTGSAVTRGQVETDPVASATQAAHLTNATVLLKGASTLVVSPNPQEALRVQADAPPWLATAGAGDVLAGLCGVLAAAGLPMRDVGSLAALVHGVAANRANPGGPIRALAVAHAIPGTVASLLSR